MTASANCQPCVRSDVGTAGIATAELADVDTAQAAEAAGCR